MNYLNELLLKLLKAQILAQNPRLKGKAFCVRVEHDDWCDQINGKGPCNCNPNIVMPKTEQTDN